MEIALQFHEFIGQDGDVQRFLFIGETGITGMATKTWMGNWKWHLHYLNGEFVGAEHAATWHELLSDIQEALAREKRFGRLDRLRQDKAL